MGPATSEDRVRTIGVVLFPQFELLDVFGPLEAFGNLKRCFRVILAAESAGLVESAQGPQVLADYAFADCPHLDVLFVPGGPGTRTEVDNHVLIRWLTERSGDAELITSVCTGAALLARAGPLNGRRATTNKQAFAWGQRTGPDVNWVPRARWVDDGNVVTSSGVSAGIDMALHLVERLAGDDVAERVATSMEYRRQRDPEDDPFAPPLISGSE
jgi:transcriptional regulator GlxA family with amidase domain